MCCIVHDWPVLVQELLLHYDFMLREALVAFVPPMSIEDRPLMSMVVRSQTYCPKHILAYVSEKARCALVMGFSSFWTDF